MISSEHWVVDLVINTDERETAAQANLTTGHGAHVLTTGTVDRPFQLSESESDAPKELAAAVALAHLAERLRVSAAETAEGAT